MSDTHVPKPAKGAPAAAAGMPAQFAVENVEEFRARMKERPLTKEQLRKLLTHRFAVLRLEAARALAELRDFDPLLDLLRDLDPTLRVEAVRLLARARDAEAAYRFVRAMRHLDPDVRQAAFEEVNKWSGAGRDKLLLIAMDDRDPRRRRAALDQLQLRSLEAVARGLRDASLVEPAQKLFAQIPDDRLVGALGSDEDGGARGLLKKRGASAVPLIVGKLESEKEAASALDLLFDLTPDAAKITLEMWPKMAPGARALGIDRVPELARAGADDADPRVKRIAVRTLLRKGEWRPEWIAFLFMRVGTDGWTEWDLVLIVRNLAKTGEGTPDLVEAAQGNYPLVRREAAQALARRGATEELAGLRDSDDSWVIREVAVTLGEKGDYRSIIPLVRTAREARGPIRRRAAELLKQFPETETFEFTLRCLRYKRGSVRLWGAERLEDQCDERAIDPLMELLGDENCDIQFAVIRALSRFATQERVTARLIGCLDYGDLSVRLAAVEVLGAARAVNAVPALIRALSNCFIRKKVMVALKQIGDRQGLLAVLRRKRRDEHVAKERKRIRDLNKRTA